MLSTRSTFLRTTAAAGALAACALPAAAAAPVSLVMRWYGGGVYELATPDDSQIVLVDAWIWNNAGFARFNIAKPPELASAQAYVAALQARKPASIAVALTHDHGDHAGDYFELLRALVDAGLPVQTLGHAELMRNAFAPKFKDAGLDRQKLVVNNGEGLNFGGMARVGSAAFRLVPAVHSTTTGAPAAGFIIDVGGTRIYASGDTDEFGDMALIARRYRPVLGVFCAGGGPYTMNPEDAADAARVTGVTSAVPVHYGHNALVLGPEAGQRFSTALARVAPGVAATVFTPGQRITLRLNAAS